MAADALAAASPKRSARERRRVRRRLTMAVLLLVPVVILALKLSGTPLGEALRDALSLHTHVGRINVHVAHVLLVPLGALLAVFFRLTLGIRVLGPFRSVLLAIAFLMTGLTVGLVFVAVVLAAVVAVRPFLSRLKLPYYARLSATLSTVALVIAVTMLVGRGFGWQELTKAGYFPIVVLSLTAEGFASTYRREGPRSALWRGFATVLLGVLITGIAAIPGFEALLLEYPELLLVEVGLMLAISEFMGFRLLAGLNPPVRRKRRRKKKGAARRRAAREAAAAAAAATVNADPLPESQPS